MLSGGRERGAASRASSWLAPFAAAAAADAAEVAVAAAAAAAAAAGTAALAAARTAPALAPQTAIQHTVKGPEFPSQARVGPTCIHKRHHHPSTSTSTDDGATAVDAAGARVPLQHSHVSDAAGSSLYASLRKWAGEFFDAGAFADSAFSS